MQSTVSLETQVLWVPAQISDLLPSPGRSPELGWGWGRENLLIF